MGDVIPLHGRAPGVPDATLLPVSPQEVRQAIEAALEKTLEATDSLTALLDRIDGDPDREDAAELREAEANGDDEPNLGAPVGGDNQTPWAAGGCRDLEQALTRLGRACRAIPSQETTP